MTVGTTIKVEKLTFGINFNQSFDYIGTGEDLDNIDAYVNYALPYESVSVYLTMASGNIDKDDFTGEYDQTAVGIKATF